MITKTDLAGPAGFDESLFHENVHQVNPGVEIIRSCARTGTGVRHPARPRPRRP
ncbi:hypothetical protein LT493_31505 [Streptomyces tricolor]|nr:hypothetical protein [Streptomyces tricolor]